MMMTMYTYTQTHRRQKKFQFSPDCIYNEKKILFFLQKYWSLANHEYDQIRYSQINKKKTEKMKIKKKSEPPQKNQ